jgi:hypothetical protein
MFPLHTQSESEVNENMKFIILITIFAVFKDGELFDKVEFGNSINLQF